MILSRLVKGNCLIDVPCPKVHGAGATEIDLDTTQILELANKDFNTTTINTFKDLKVKMDIISEPMGDLSR